MTFAGAIMLLVALAVAALFCGMILCAWGDWRDGR